MNRAPNWCIDVLVLGDQPDLVAAASRRALGLFEQSLVEAPILQPHPLPGLGWGAWLPAFHLYKSRFEQRADGRVYLATYDARMESWIRGLANMEASVGWLVLMRQAPFLCPSTGQQEASVTAHVHLPDCMGSQEDHVRLTHSALLALLPTMFPVLSSWELLWSAPHTRDPLAQELLSRSSVEAALLAHARSQHLHAVWPSPSEVSQPPPRRL